MKLEAQDWIPGEHVIEWSPETLRRQALLATGTPTATVARVLRHEAETGPHRVGRCCDQCGRRFAAVRVSASFCSNRCRQRAKRRRTKTTR